MLDHLPRLLSRRAARHGQALLFAVAALLLAGCDKSIDGIFLPGDNVSFARKIQLSRGGDCTITPIPDRSNPQPKDVPCRYRADGRFLVIRVEQPGLELSGKHSAYLHKKRDAFVLYGHRWTRQR